MDKVEDASKDSYELEEKSSNAEGSYIQERKRNIEYLDLQTDKLPKTTKEHPGSSVSAVTSTKPASPNVLLSSTDRCDTKEDSTPIEQPLKDHSFDNEFSELYSDDSSKPSSSLKRTIDEANLKSPENQYLTLDEIEERKRVKLEGASTSKCFNTQKCSKTIRYGYLLCNERITIWKILINACIKK